MSKPNRKNKKQGNRKLASPKAFSPGVVAITMNIETFVAKYTTTVTTGVIATNNSIQAAMIDSFAARFVGFDQYRIRSVRFQMDCCASTNPGVINVWVEPSGAGVPNATNAKDNYTCTFSAGDNSKHHILTYNPRDPATQVWTAVATTTSPIGYLKVYTNNADFAASTVATDYLVVMATLVIEFRGYA